MFLEGIEATDERHRDVTAARTILDALTALFDRHRDALGDNVVTERGVGYSFIPPG